MRWVHRQGVGQAVLPPARRPRLDVLRRLGFGGSDAQVLDAAWRDAPQLVAACYSAATMWTANAATVSPSADCADGRVHLTPANLATSLHRAIEAEETARMLRAVFADPERFVVHDPLPATMTLSDEGAANHTRLAAPIAAPGLELFVYGRAALGESSIGPRKFPARQTREACQAVARLHGLEPAATVYARQHPDAIDAGVFHNDVISVGNANVFLYHERALWEPGPVLEAMQAWFRDRGAEAPVLVEITTDELPLADAVSSYLFNSQLLSVAEGMLLLCPTTCQQNARAKACTERLLTEDNPIRRIEFIDVQQSMNNGGGPACLRLRVALSETERAAVLPGVLADERLLDRLERWVDRHYRESLSPDDLRDPQLIREVDQALEALAPIIGVAPETLGLR